MSMHHSPARQMLQCERRHNIVKGTASYYSKHSCKDGMEDMCLQIVIRHSRYAKTQRTFRSSQGIRARQEPNCILQPPSAGQGGYEGAHCRLVHWRPTVCFQLLECVCRIIHPPQL